MELLRMQTKCVFSSKRFTVACKLQQCKCATQSTTCSVHYQINNRNRKWMKVVGSLWKVGNLPSHNLKVLFLLQLISMEGGSSPSTFHKQANLSKNIDVQVQSFFFPNKLFELNGSVLFLQHFMYIYSSYMLKYQSLNKPKIIGAWNSLPSCTSQLQPEHEGKAFPFVPKTNDDTTTKAHMFKGELLLQCLNTKNAAASKQEK